MSTDAVQDALTKPSRMPAGDDVDSYVQTKLEALHSLMPRWSELFREEDEGGEQGDEDGVADEAKKQEFSEVTAQMAERLRAWQEERSAIS